MTATEAPEAPFTTTLSRNLAVADRCDACGAQAFVIALFPGGRELMFCGHHGRQYAPGLIAKGAAVDDQTERINAKPSVSANV